MLCARELFPTRHYVVAGRPHEIPNQVELMGVALAGNNGLSDKHFAKYTANTPHINGRCILPQLEQQLGRSVPSRDDQARIISASVTHRSPGPWRRAVVVSGQTEVGNLQ